MHRAALSEKRPHATNQYLALTVGRCPSFLDGQQRPPRNSGFPLKFEPASHALLESRKRQFHLRYCGNRRSNRLRHRLLCPKEPGSEIAAALLSLHWRYLLACTQEKPGVGPYPFTLCATHPEKLLRNAGVMTGSWRHS